MYDERLGRTAWAVQRRKAKHRGISWQLTYEQWRQIWLDSEKWALRGRKRGCYAMCRYGDVGPYSVDNVFIGGFGDNVGDPKSQPVTIDGIIYRSHHDAARCTGIPRSTITYRANRGIY